MINQSPKDKQNGLRCQIQSFLDELLEAKLKDLDPDAPEREVLKDKFSPSKWLENAARRASQIKAVTHSLKPIHPDAKGSSLYVNLSKLPVLDELGSHAISNGYEIDVVGNAAALDVYKFLRIDYDGQTFLELAEKQDEDFAWALSDDLDRAQGWMVAFAAIRKPDNAIRSHNLAKQIYWWNGDDPHNDDHYHLLAPLYPTSLVQKIYGILQDDRFGDDAKTARRARRESKWSPIPVHNYADLAVQKLGGTKPQNISQLNSERRGTNYLLASLPPVWNSRPARPVNNAGSMFTVFGRRRVVRELVKQLRNFLISNPAPTVHTRNTRGEFIETLIEEFIQFTAETHTLPPGWTEDVDCELDADHKVWLDPYSQNLLEDSVADTIAAGFSRWLNACLKDPLPMGDPEFVFWKKQALKQFNLFIGDIADAG